ncbi:MAG TPA: M1 family metallopeptidase [Bryobacteraceae bacterium]|nr:M1 family metallopeptidase [Bryobacteraceae bacterium]
MRRAVACWALLAGSLYSQSFYLSTDVIPRKETVELTIDPARETFEGSVLIDVELRGIDSTVWLNARNLTIRSVFLDGGDTIRPTEVIRRSDERIGIYVGDQTGPVAIQIDYQGRLDDKALTGPYRRKVEGEWYAYSTFAAIEARRAFPCFDEPRFKTPWDMSIRVKRENKAFSNGRQISETEEPNGWKLVKFATTEPLPAEMVAFAVGPFDIYQGEPAGHGTPVAVITPKGHAEEGHAAAQATAAILPRLEAYTGIPYAFGKLDHLGLPAGAFGAVENPGLITYRARNLLVPPNQETATFTRALRALQAHEIGHQWFGNLVTQASWDDVWLSEGFATWISAKMMDQEEPPERAHLAAIAARERIMAVDNPARSRPVRIAINSRETARDVYDRVVYDKGAAILLMLEGWLGEDRFRDGLRAYLNEHRFGNATTDDLAAALRAASGNDTSRVLNTFLNTTGVPELRGQMLCDRDTAPRLRVTKSSPGSVPVCWRADRVASSCTVLEGSSTEISLPTGTACPAWFYLNSGGTGYYRTRWTQAPLLALRELTDAEKLTLVYDLRFSRNASAQAALSRLESDADPEISTAAREAIK